MAKNLVIVESPGKIKNLEQYFGSDYKVVASVGHIKDLPEKSLGIDIEGGFIPEYIVTDDKKKVVENLKKMARTHKEVFIATDDDREGEAIGWHVCNEIGLDPKTVKRISFKTTSKEDVLEGMRNPRLLDLNFVDAQQARRLLDRLVGYKVSPVLWSKIRKGLSAGRVQSVAVKIIIEREREIINFKPEESWKLSTILEYNKSQFKAIFTKQDDKIKNFKSIEDVKKFLNILFSELPEFKITKNKSGNDEINIIKSINFKLNFTEKKDSKRSPGAPFTTSTLQQEASRKFGFGVKQTMMIAQKLYEGVDLGNGEITGLITYMRTDSVNLSENILLQATNFVNENYGKNYLKIRKYKGKSANAQEAHEAIRPSYLTQTPESLSHILEPQALKLYTLIWKRTIASQMSDAIVEVTTFNFSPVGKENQSWITKGEVVKFDGFMKLYVESSDDELDEDDEAKILPNIPDGEILESKSINFIQSFTKPPARYTEASLIKKLDTEGIGRPATYAPTVSTIIDRGYIEKFEKKYLKPTEVAFTVNDFLEKYFTEMMDYKFTKKIEEELDEIANGKIQFQEMLKIFWEKTLKRDLDNAGATAEKVIEKTGELCPKCNSELIFRHSKGGKFIGCSAYPKCDFLEQPKDEVDKLTILREKYEGKPCPDGIEGTIVVKTGKFGPFLTSSKYPEVKRIGKVKSDKDDLLDQILKEKGLLIDAESGEELVVKNSKRGPFLAALKYPEVKIAKPIPKDVWDELKIRQEKLEQTEQ